MQLLFYIVALPRQRRKHATYATNYTSSLLHPPATTTYLSKPPLLVLTAFWSALAFYYFIFLNVNKMAQKKTCGNTNHYEFIPCHAVGAVTAAHPHTYTHRYEQIFSHLFVAAGIPFLFSVYLFLIFII